MHVTLVATDGPLAYLGEFFAAVLNAGVIAGSPDHGLELEVIHFTALPNEELVEVEMVRARCPASDSAVLNRPEFRIAVPAGEILPVEDGLEFLGMQARAEAQGKKDTGDRFHRDLTGLRRDSNRVVALGLRFSTHRSSRRRYSAVPNRVMRRSLGRERAGRDAMGGWETRRIQINERNFVDHKNGVMGHDIADFATQ